MAKKKIKRQTKTIVTGHLEQVSRKVFTEFQKQITELVGNNFGIYALYNKSGQLYYVGLATDLKKRVKQHLYR